MGQVDLPLNTGAITIPGTIENSDPMIVYGQTLAGIP